MNQKIFGDTKIGKKMSCGRTKAETLVREVLAPKAVRDVINVLLPVVPGQKPPFFAFRLTLQIKETEKCFRLQCNTSHQRMESTIK